MSACECLTVCGWVLCNYLPWLGFLFWVHSEKFHTEIVCTDKIEVESFWLLIYLPMRSVWWKSPGSAHKVKQSHTESHLHTYTHIIQFHCRAHSHTFTLLPPLPIDRAKFLCLLEVHFSASSAAITISGRVILLHSAAAPEFLLVLLLLLLLHLLLFLLHLSRYALLQSIGTARGELCDAKLIEQANTNWASFFAFIFSSFSSG